MEYVFRSSIPEPSIRNSCSSDRFHRLQNKQPLCSSRKTSLRPAFCCYSFRGVHTFLSSPFCRHAFSRLERPLTQTRNRPEEQFQQRIHRPDRPCAVTLYMERGMALLLAGGEPVKGVPLAFNDLATRRSGRKSASRAGEPRGGGTSKACCPISTPTVVFHPPTGPPLQGDQAAVGSS